MANLTIAHRRCNLAKGNSTPYEAFGSNPPGYVWQEILTRAGQFKNPRKRDRFAPDATEKLQEKGDFIASQLTDTAYIAKAASYYTATSSARIF
jgi:CRISPR-associated endonuclease Csn1